MRSFCGSHLRVKLALEMTHQVPLNLTLLGLGAMGQRVAQRLQNGPFRLTVYNRSSEPAQVFAEQGVRVAATPKEAVEAADVVMSFLKDDDASRQVWLDERIGGLKALKPTGIVVESSTLSLAWVRELSCAFSDEGKRFLEAPVVGSRPQAETGQLVYLVGGSADVLEAVRPLLELLGSIHHVGSVGAGAAVKLSVNALFAQQVAGLSEVLGMLQKSADISPDKAMSLLEKMPVASPVMKGVGRLIVQGHYAPLFPIELVTKDLRYVMALGGEREGGWPVMETVRRSFEEAELHGLGRLNIHALAKRFLEQK